MTDLDTLRRALRAQQDLGPGGPSAPDLGEVMTRGKRLRLRRRLTAAGGAVCAAAVVFGTVSGISHPTRSAPVPGQRPAGSAKTVPSPSPRQTHISTPVPVLTPGSSASPGQGAGTSSPIPTPSKAAGTSSSIPTPSETAGSAPGATIGTGIGPTPVATPSQGQLAIFFLPGPERVWSDQNRPLRGTACRSLPYPPGVPRGMRS